MRRLGVLLVLLAVMLGVRALKAEPTGSSDPMVLAAIGFVLLAAFTIAQMGSALSLPRVTGYIVAGVVLGPSVANILSHGVVTEMRMFNTLALGLIATAAGLGLDARQMARLSRTLTVTIALKVLLGLVLVGGTLYAWELGFGPLGIDRPARVVALALVFGVLSLGTSPAIALAVTTELRSRGRLSDLVLGAAVLKDLVVVVGLAVTIGVGQRLVGEPSTGDGSPVLTVASELSMSMGVGAALGILLILYLRYVRAEMLLFVAAMILVTAEVSKVLHLELLLVFISAGVVVKNFSRFGDDLAQPVEMVALPVFVVFFTNAGASVNLAGTWRVLPLALALAFARTVAYFVAARLGGRAGRESAVVRDNAWLGYLPQAGVTLGLVALAASQMPSLAQPIRTLGMAVVAVNLLIGPVALRYVLRRAGEAASGPSEAEDSRTVEEQVPSVEPGATVAGVLDGIASQRIRVLATGVARDVAELGKDFVDAHIGQWAKSVRAELAHLDADVTDLEHLAGWASRESPWLASDRAEAGAALFRRIRQRLRRLPDTAEFGFEPHHYHPSPGDRATVIWKKRALRWRRWFGRRSKRRVPLMAAARAALEGRLSRACIVCVRGWNVTEAAILADLERHVLGEFGPRETLESIRQRLERLQSSSRAELERALALGIGEFATVVGDAGSPTLPLGNVRYSRTEAEVRSALSSMTAEGEEWERALQGARLSVFAAARLGSIRHSALDKLESSVVVPMMSAIEASAAVLSRVSEALAAVGHDVGASAFDGEEQRSALPVAARRVFDEAVWNALEQEAARFRSGVSTHVLTLALRQALDALPEQLRLGDARALAMHAEPSRAVLADLRVAALFADILLHELLPGVDEEVRRAAAAMVHLNRWLRDVQATTDYALEQVDAEGRAAYPALRAALERAAAKLQEQARDLTASGSAAREGIHDRILSAFEALTTALLEPARATDSRRARAWARAARVMLVQGRTALGRWQRNWGAAVARLGRSDVSRDLLSLYRKPHLDANSLRDLLHRHTEHAPLPENYVRLFAHEPLSGPRLFTAYRQELARLVSAERVWLEGGPSSALIVGTHGSGRSSILNQCKLELSAPRMLWPEPLQWRRDLGIVGALAVTLGARPTPGPLMRALSSVRTTILIDDLEHWLTPDLAGLADLERFLDIVVRTSDNVFWIVSVESGAHALFEETVPLAQAFGSFVRLEPLDAQQIRGAVEARHALSGRVLHHEPGPLSALRERLPGLGDTEVVWKVLAGLSEGNLARTMSLWLRSLRLRDDGELVTSVGGMLHATLPVLSWLKPRDQALLTQLLRFGPLRVSQLCGALRRPRSDIVRQLGFLRASGLVVGGSTERDPARVPPALLPMVGQSLRLSQVRP